MTKTSISRRLLAAVAALLDRDNRFPALARLKRGRAAVMLLTRRPDGTVQLLGVQPHEGSLPSCADLEGTVYQSVACARNAVVSRLRAADQRG